MKDIQSLTEEKMTRREMLSRLAYLSAGMALPFGFAGCAMDPVTGKKQLMMVSEQQEVAIDQKYSPFQFSSDYGITRHKGINGYMSKVGKSLLPNVHRPGMPYNFQCVNAAYINAYAFPGGSIAVTRGILLEMDNEAQLAALLGHELGHVNARHSAEQMSKSQLSSLLVQGATIAAATQGTGLGRLTQQLGMLGQGLLLSRYSRDNEREADALGNQYMVQAGYSSRGFVGLMEMLDSLHKGKENASQVLFSTHPMSSERLSSARQRMRSIYHGSAKNTLYRDRYMDRIAHLRKKKKGIKLLQDGEKHLRKKELSHARNAFKQSVKLLKKDYAAYAMLAKCYMLMDNPDQALKYAKIAKKIYPNEPQALYLSGLAQAELKKFDRAYLNFAACDAALPGNPQLKFYSGYCQDKLKNKQTAADHYMAYLKMINYQSNKYSQYAYKRLQKWGYAK